MTTLRKLEKQAPATTESARTISFCQVSCAYAEHVERTFGQVCYGRFEEVDTRHSPGVSGGSARALTTVDEQH